MLQQAMRRLVPQAFGAAQAQAGAVTRLEEFGSRMGAGVHHQGLDMPLMHAQFSTNVHDEEASCKAQYVGQLPAGLAGMFSRPKLSAGLSRPSMLLPSTFASGPAMPAVHGFSTGLMMPKGLGGIALGPRRMALQLPSSPAGSVRSFATEGQLLGHAFMLSTDVMFWTGLIGAVVFRRNLIVMLLATEIVMLACNLNFLFASAYLNDMTGVIMSITITTIAACETAIGLALCVTYFHMRSATDVEALNFLK